MRTSKTVTLSLAVLVLIVAALFGHYWYSKVQMRHLLEAEMHRDGAFYPIHKVGLRDLSSTTQTAIIILAPLVLIVALVFGPRWRTQLKIRRQVVAQLSQGLPHLQRCIDGKDYQLQSIDVSHCRRSLDGQKYDVQLGIRYTGSTGNTGLQTQVGGLLVRDDWGIHRGDFGVPFPNTPVVNVAVELR